jgi:dethiobiotin synthetase
VTDTPGYFITGTDTGVGKTVITLGLMQWLQDRGHRVAAMKPVASGCEPGAHGLRNADALLLQQQATVMLPYEQVNPYAFEPAIAPHLAAAGVGVGIEVDAIVAGCRALQRAADRVCVEGVGGWLVPLNERETVADLAVRLGLGVVLVVGIRLGCLNHALLTARAIESTGLTLAGWVANRLPPPADFAQENIAALEARLAAPLLGIVPPLAEIDARRVAACLSLAAG